MIGRFGSWKVRISRIQLTSKKLSIINWFSVFFGYRMKPTESWYFQNVNHFNANVIISLIINHVPANKSRYSGTKRYLALLNLYHYFMCSIPLISRFRRLVEHWALVGVNQIKTILMWVNMKFTKQKLFNYDPSFFRSSHYFISVRLWSQIDLIYAFA